VLIHQIATVDVEDLTRDEACTVRGEKRHRLGHFLWFSQPLQGDSLHNLAALFLGPFLAHVRLDGVWGHGVHVDAIRGELSRQRLGKGINGTLGGPIGWGGGDVAHLAHHGGDVDDLSSSLFDHKRNHLFGTVERPPQVDAEDLLPVLRIVLEKSPPPDDPGVIHQGINLAEEGDRFADQPLYRFVLGGALRIGDKPPKGFRRPAQQLPAQDVGDQVVIP
jgi:hypothetical protein